MTTKQAKQSFTCNDDFPLHWVRANQIGILLCIIITMIIGQPWMMVVALAVQLISRWFGVRYNLFIRTFANLLPASSKTESRELLRFNNLLAILFMLGYLIAYTFNATITSYIFLGMLTIAVVLALCGFCLGCFMYFQWKQFWLQRKRRLGS